MLPATPSAFRVRDQPSTALPATLQGQIPSSTSTLRWPQLKDHASVPVLSAPTSLTTLA